MHHSSEPGLGNPDRRALNTPRRSASLRRELIWAVLVKLAVLILIKQVFFTHRISKEQASQDVANLLSAPADSTTQAARHPSSNFTTNEVSP